MESRFVRKCEFRSHFIWLTTAHFFAKTTHVVVRYNGMVVPYHNLLLVHPLTAYPATISLEDDAFEISGKIGVGKSRTYRADPGKRQCGGLGRKLKLRVGHSIAHVVPSRAVFTGAGTTKQSTNSSAGHFSLCQSVLTRTL